MKTVQFYDAETTGLPNWKEQSGDPCQPHIVQLASVLCNAETEEIISSMDVIIKPDGWEIPEEMTEIHGITTEMAMDVGVPEFMALDMFLALRGDIRVAHNRTFDQRIIRIAAKRYSTDATVDSWAEKEDHECSMQLARKIMPISKSPTLAEAYQFFTGKELENAHSAMADTLGCKEVYLAIQRGITTAQVA